MAYESPIKMIYDDIKTNYENGVLKAVQAYDIKVDKAELLKALKYDRAQYDKGYSDGYAKAKEDIVRCKDCAYAVDEDEEGVYCSVNDKGFRLDDFCSLGEPIGEVEE